MTNREKLEQALMMIGGPGDEHAERRRLLLKQYSGFEARPEGADTVWSMSESWARVTLEKILDAVKDGAEHFIWNEKGERVQHKLFD